MARGVVTLGNENVVPYTTLQGLVKGYWRAHELLFNLAQPVESWLKLQMVICVPFGDRRNDGDVVSFRTHIVCRRNNSNIDVCQSEVRKTKEEGQEGERWAEEGTEMTHRACARLVIVG